MALQLFVNLSYMSCVEKVITRCHYFLGIGQILIVTLVHTGLGHGLCRVSNCNQWRWNVIIYNIASWLFWRLFAWCNNWLNETIFSTINGGEDFCSFGVSFGIFHHTYSHKFVISRNDLSDLLFWLLLLKYSTKTSTHFFKNCFIIVYCFFSSDCMIGIRTSMFYMLTAFMLSKQVKDWGIRVVASDLGGWFRYPPEKLGPTMNWTSS